MITLPTITHVVLRLPASGRQMEMSLMIVILLGSSVTLEPNEQARQVSSTESACAGLTSAFSTSASVGLSPVAGLIGDMPHTLMT